jgi:hypothetical protein
MIKKLLLGAAISLLLMGGTFFLIYRLSALPDKHGDPFTTEELAQMQSGDLILRRGRGVASDFIVQFLDEPLAFTHVAMVIKPENSKPYVIQSMSSTLQGKDGVHTQFLEDFVRYSIEEGSLVVRPKLNSTDLNLVLERAESLVEEEVPFDHDFSLEDSEKLYCSELFYVLLQEVNFWNDENTLHLSPEGWIHFTSFWENPSFTHIISHLK